MSRVALLLRFSRLLLLISGVRLLFCLSTTGLLFFLVDCSGDGLSSPDELSLESDWTRRFSFALRGGDSTTSFFFFLD